MIQTAWRLMGQSPRWERMYRRPEELFPVNGKLAAEDAEMRRSELSDPISVSGVFLGFLGFWATRPRLRSLPSLASTPLSRRCTLMPRSWHCLTNSRVGLPRALIERMRLALARSFSMLFSFL